MSLTIFCNYPCSSQWDLATIFALIQLGTCMYAHCHLTPFIHVSTMYLSYWKALTYIYRYQCVMKESICNLNLCKECFIICRSMVTEHNGRLLVQHNIFLNVNSESILILYIQKTNCFLTCEPPHKQSIPTIYIHCN